MKIKVNKICILLLSVTLTGTRCKERTFDEHNYQAQLLELYSDQRITKRDLLNYLTYPFADSEFHNKTFDFFIGKVTSRANMKNIRPEFCVGDTICSHFDKTISENTEEYALSLVSENSGNRDIVIDSVLLRIHLSKFELRNILSYSSFEEPFIASKNTATTKLYVPKDILLENFQLKNGAKLPIHMEDYILELEIKYTPAVAE